LSQSALRGAFKHDTARAALTFLVGGLGGALFYAISFPLPWLLGALSAALTASLAGAPVGISSPVRAFLLIVLGIMLGGTFTPDVLNRAGEWTPTLIGVAVYLVIVTLAAFFYCRSFIKMDRITAIFSALPGGLSQMIIVGEENGADIRSLTLIHAVRVASILMMIPPILFYWHGDTAPAAAFLSEYWSGVEVLILLGSAVAGVFLARLAHLPAAFLTGPLLASAGVHLSGLIAGGPPSEISIAVQIAMGSTIGARFCGVSIMQLGRLMGLAFGLAVMMMSVTLLAAWLLASATGLPFDALVLAFAPGGFAEMALAALSMNIDPSFVSTHHGLRLIIIVIMAPIIISHVIRRTKRKT